jgi:translation initiation factor 1
MSNSRLVYSTDGGDARRRRAPESPVAGVPNDGVVRVSREKGGRRGKTVTIVRGVPRGDADAVASELKRLCAAGGKSVDGVVEIQGDHRDKVAARLRDRGYTVKLAGG